MIGKGLVTGWKRGVGALALLSLALPATADAKGRHHAHPHPPRWSLDTSGFGAFTPAAADPRLAAAFARSGLGTANLGDGAFRFTPSGNGGRRAITVAVRAHAVSRAEAAKALAVASEIAPSAYSLGMAVGWKRFALSGAVVKAEGGLLAPDHQMADIGFSVSGRRWATKLDLSADRATDDRLDFPQFDQSWSVGLGGTYALTRNLELSGGVRYKAQHDQLQSLADDRREGQAVYLGTTFRF